MNLIRKNDIAIYCSNHNKFEISNKEQVEKLKKYCRHFDLNIVDEYIDYGDDYKEFNRLLNDIKTKKFNIVLSLNFDTLPKDEKYVMKLINELEKYNYELQLESSYIYKPILKPLFKLERNDNIIEGESKKKKSGKAKCYPTFEYYEVKNPKSDEVYNWVKLIDEDNFRIEETPIYDELGNYLGDSKKVYVIFKKVLCYNRIGSKKKKDERKAVPKRLF